jgi:hypothetical protein
MKNGRGRILEHFIHAVVVVSVSNRTNLVLFCVIFTCTVHCAASFRQVVTCGFATLGQVKPISGHYD